MDKNIIYKLWFSNVKINDGIKFILLEQFNNERNIYENRKELSFSNSNLKYLVDIDLDSEIIEKQIKDIESEKYNLLFYNDDKYPEKLKNIQNYPYALYYKGNVDRLSSKTSIAIVGSRKCSNYGAEVTKYIVSNLENYDLNIISGGAFGIDTIAHRIAVDKKIYNVAVFGCGIDVCYPANNKSLYSSIEKNGLLLSEFLPNTAPFAYNFPRRNRIISGLSQCVIVVEAGVKSGSLITASYAANQGRDVFAVPGSIFSPLSSGVNKLINDGAIIFNTIDDLIEGIKLAPRKNHGSYLQDGLKGKILKLLEDKPMHIDEIIRIVNIDTSLIYELLFEMQFNKEIISLTGNYYAKII